MSNQGVDLHPRQQRHHEIRALVEQGLLEQSIFHFLKALQEHGPHVGMLCDLAGTYYELGRYQEFRHTVIEVKKQLDECQKLLSRDSARRTYLMLSKFYEEMAEPALAFESLQFAAKYCDDFEDKKWIDLQELRIRSYFGQHKGLSSKYLHAVESTKNNANLLVEVQHCLMWTEWALFGYGECEKRWMQSLGLNLNVIDLRLMSRDFLEISLRSGVNKTELIEKAKKILIQGAMIDYDKVLLRLIETGEPGNDLGLALSDMMRIRVVQLTLAVEKTPALKEELRRKFLFLINDLSRESKELFDCLLTPADDERLRIITVYVNHRKLIVDGNKALSLTSLQMKFLLVCVNQGQLSLETLAEKIWHSQADESAYHRMRMMMYKLNGELNLRLGFVPFELKKDGLIIHPLLRIATV